MGQKGVKKGKKEGVGAKRVIFSRHSGQKAIHGTQLPTTVKQNLLRGRTR